MSGGSHGGEILFARSDDGGRTFTDAINLSNTTAGAGKGRLNDTSWHNGSYDFVRSSDGRIVAAWTEYEGNLRTSFSANDGRYHLRYTKMPKGEPSFAAPREIVSPGAAGADSVHLPMLRIDGQDRLYLAWEQFPNRRGRPQGIGFTYSTDHGETFATPQIVPTSDDRALGSSGSQQGLLASKLAVNDAGAFAVSNSTYNDGRESRVRVYRGQLRKE